MIIVLPGNRCVGYYMYTCMLNIMHMRPLQVDKVCDGSCTTKFHDVLHVEHLTCRHRAVIQLDYEQSFITTLDNKVKPLILYCAVAYFYNLGSLHMQYSRNGCKDFAIGF